VCVSRQFVSTTTALGLLFLVFGGLLAAQPGVQIPALPNGHMPNVLPHGAARVLEISGQVSVMRKGDWWAVMPDTIITPGQEILSGPDGHMMIQLEDTSHVEVFPNSRLIFRSNHFNLTDLIDLMLGKVRVHIEKFGGRPNPYQMRSPTALIAVRGTTFEVSNTEDGLTTVSVEEGAVDVTHRLRPNGKTVSLTPGESLTVYPNEVLSQNHIDRIRVGSDVMRRIAQQAIDIWQRTGGGAGSTNPGTGSTTASNGGGSTTGAPGAGSTGSGSGTNTPPTNGRPGSGTGSGDNGSGSPTPPSTGTGTGTGTGGTTPPTNSGPRTIKKSH
jgi:hypothetical protein